VLRPTSKSPLTDAYVNDFLFQKVDEETVVVVAAAAAAVNI
jgi:hypothetical protein